jgi:hypothetical protein
MPVYVVPPSPEQKAIEEQRAQQEQQIKGIFTSVSEKIKSCHDLIQTKKKLTYTLAFLEQQAVRGSQLTQADLGEVIEAQEAECEKIQRGIKSIEDTLAKVKESPLPFKDLAEAERGTSLTQELKARRQKSGTAQANLKTLLNLQIGKESLDISAETEIAREALSQTQKQLDEIIGELETQYSVSLDTVEQADLPDNRAAAFFGNQIAYLCAQVSLVRKGIVPLDLLDAVYFNHTLGIAVENPGHPDEETAEDDERRYKVMIDRTIGELREAVFPYHQLQDWMITDAFGRGHAVFEIKLEQDKTGSPICISCTHYRGNNSRTAWARLNVDSLHNTIVNLLWVERKWWQVWLRKPVFPEHWGSVD